MKTLTINPRQLDNNRMAYVLRVISNPFRLRIVQILSRGRGKELSVSTINQELNLEQSLISHHLIKLKDTGVVNSRREGRSVFYSLAKEDTRINSLLMSMSTSKAV